MTVPERYSLIPYIGILLFNLVPFHMLGDFFFPPSFFRQSVLVHMEISGGGLLRFSHARKKIRGTFYLP